VLHGKWHVYPELAAAGLWTTPRDLARFALAVQEAAGGRANRLFTPALVTEMLTSRSDASYGLGLGIEGGGPDQRFGHGGGNEGFRCQLVAYTHRGQGAVVMTNSDNGGRLIGEILRSIAAEYGWPGYLQPERDVVTVEPQLYDDYAGVYRMADGTEITVFRDGDALYGQAAGEPRTRAWPTSDSTFFTEDDGNGRALRARRRAPGHRRGDPPTGAGDAGAEGPGSVTGPSGVAAARSRGAWRAGASPAARYMKRHARLPARLPPCRPWRLGVCPSGACAVSRRHAARRAARPQPGRQPPPPTASRSFPS